MVRQIKFKVGESVMTPGKPGRITHIGEWREGGSLIAVVYRVSGKYWQFWQLTRRRGKK